MAKKSYLKKTKKVGMVKTGNRGGANYRINSPIVVLKLNIMVVAPVWGCAKATPNPNAFTRRPAPIEKPDRKLRL